MKTLAALATLALLTACGGDSPATCDPSTRGGVYTVALDLQSGNCGALPSFASTAPGQPNPGCVYAVNQTSADGCRVDMDLTCTNSGSGETDRYVGYAEQQDKSGDTLDGIVTVYAHLGASSCSGTYGATFSRR